MWTLALHNILAQFVLNGILVAVTGETADVGACVSNPKAACAEEFFHADVCVHNLSKPSALYSMGQTALALCSPHQFSARLPRHLSYIQGPLTTAIPVEVFCYLLYALDLIPHFCAKRFALWWPPWRFHKIHRRPRRRGMINPLAERKEVAPVPCSRSRLLCWALSTCASFSLLEADVLCVARFPRLARPLCRGCALPLEERRDVFRVLQKLPLETKGEDAEQGPKEAAAGATARAEVSAGRDGGPSGEQVRVVVSVPFARHARMVVLCLWNLLGTLPRVLPLLGVTFVLIPPLLWRTTPRFPCSADARARQGGAPRLPGTPCRSGKRCRYGDGT